VKVERLRLGALPIAVTSAAIALASAVAVASAPAASGRADIIVYGARYFGELNGHKVADANLASGPGKEITDESKIKFAASCSGYWPSSAGGCYFRDWSIAGTVTTAYTWKQGCTLPIGLDTAQYNKSPNFFYFGPARGKFFRPSPRWFDVSATPAHGFLSELHPDSGDPGYSECNGVFLFIDKTQSTTTKGVVDSETNIVHDATIIVPGQAPNPPYSSGFSRYQATLLVTLHPGPDWDLDQIAAQIGISLQQLANGIKNFLSSCTPRTTTPRGTSSSGRRPEARAAAGSLSPSDRRSSCSPSTNGSTADSPGSRSG
jgi:hypothetical protein